MADLSTAFNAVAGTIAAACGIFGIVKIMTDLKGGSRKSIRDEYEFQNKLQKDWDKADVIHPATRDLALYAFAGRKDMAPDQIAYFIRHPGDLHIYAGVRTRLAPIDESRRIAFKPEWASKAKRRRQKIMCNGFLVISLLFPLIPFLLPPSAMSNRGLEVAVAIAYTLLLDMWVLYQLTRTTRAEALVDRQPLLSDPSVPQIDPLTARIAADAAVAIEAARNAPGIEREHIEV